MAAQRWGNPQIPYDHTGMEHVVGLLQGCKRNAKMKTYFIVVLLLLCIKVNKVTSTMLHKRAQTGTHLPLLGLQPVGGEPLMSVTRGQCDARPTVTFPAARHHHRPLAGVPNYTAW